MGIALTDAYKASYAEFFVQFRSFFSSCSKIYGLSLKHADYVFSSFFSFFPKSLRNYTYRSYIFLILKLTVSVIDLTSITAKNAMELHSQDQVS